MNASQPASTSAVLPIVDDSQRDTVVARDKIRSLITALKRTEATTVPDDDPQAQGDCHAALTSIGAQFAQRRLTEF